MSKPIGMTGLRRLTNDAKVKEATFPLDTSVSKVVALDPTKSYAILCSGAGPADLTIEMTADSHDAIANGTARYAPATVYSNIAAAGGFLGNAVGATGVRVTHVKDGVGVDDANTVALLGGRYQVRFVEGGVEADIGLDAYTPVTPDA